MLQHQLSIPPHLQPLSEGLQATGSSHSGGPIITQPDHSTTSATAAAQAGPKPSSKSGASAKLAKKGLNPSSSGVNDRNQAHEGPHGGLGAGHPVQNVYSNAYSKKSTAELIRQRLNISGPNGKKKNGGHFSQSDEMQYKRQSGLKDFQILQKLGDGAYSSVYKVKRMEDGQTYALKKVKIASQSHKDKENAINEVRILANIDHPNVVAYKEAFIDRDTQSLCLVMQLADGGDLLKMISDRKKRKVHFRESQVWRVLIETVYGLRAMHELSVMHRDIKSANIFMFKNQMTTQAEGGNLYQSKLGDMNVSKVTNQNGLNYTQTGTPYYASPEVWKDEPYGYKSDVWSLGCVIYEMLALKPPFSGRDMDHLYKRVCKGIFPRIPDHYSNDIWAIVQLMLRIDPEKRPDCNQLIQSKMFQIYTEKLNSLESVDNTFKQTLKSASPDRVQISKITNSLLTQLHLPAHDITNLGKMLPQRNYDSAQTTHGKQAGALMKTASHGVEESRDLSSTSRKLHKIRNQHNQQRTAINATEASRHEADTMLKPNQSSEHSPPAKAGNQKQSKQQQSSQQQNAISTVSPKMTKIQSKLQRQYLKQKNESSDGGNSASVLENQALRSNNPTTITNRSASKQSNLIANTISDRASDRENNNASLRNRLNNKRKQVYKGDAQSVERENELDSQLEVGARNMHNRNKTTSKKQQPLKSNNSVVRQKSSVLKEAAPSSNFDQQSSQNNANQQNVKSSQELQALQVSPNLNQEKSKVGPLKQTRLSLPLVAGLSPTHAANSLPGSRDSSPARKGENMSPMNKNQVTSLPQLSEIESENISQTDIIKMTKEQRYQNILQAQSKIANSRGSVPIGHAQSYAMTADRQNEDCDIYEGDYSKLGNPINQSTVSQASSSVQPKMGKRHASFDIINGIQGSAPMMINNQAMGGANNPMHLPPAMIASQGAIPLVPSDMMAANSSRLPESHSYSQINMINKKNIMNLAKNNASTSSSEDLKPSFIQHQEVVGMSDVGLKHQLRMRYNKNLSGHYSSSNHASAIKDKSMVSKIQNTRPSIHSQHQDMGSFSKNQQQSVRHQYSDANFSLNSEDLRHNVFQNSLPHHNQLASLAEEGPVSMSARRHMENPANKAIIKLPQIEQRKKSYEGHQPTSDYSRKILKLQPGVLKQQNSIISKKKPSNANSKQHYSSMIQQMPLQQSQPVLPLGQSLASSTQLAKIQQNLNINLPQQSPSNVGNVQGVKVVQAPQTVVKKKTLAAYANSRQQRNTNRHNLIYTQKSGV